MRGAVTLTAQGEIVVAESDPDAVADAVNQAVADVTVAKTSDGRGYGLFAARDFRRGERVATYGGRQFDGPDAWAQIDTIHRQGGSKDYVVRVTRNTALDTGLFFRPEHAGRFVNESALGQNWMANVEGRFRRSKEGVVDYWFEAKKPIFAGDEILAYYGPEYGNPFWRWDKQEPSTELLQKMEAVVEEMKRRLKKRIAEGRFIDEAKADLKSADTQLQNKQREAARKRIKV